MASRAESVSTTDLAKDQRSPWPAFVLFPFLTTMFWLGLKEFSARLCATTGQPSDPLCRVALGHGFSIDGGFAFVAVAAAVTIGLAVLLPPDKKHDLPEVNRKIAGGITVGLTLSVSFVAARGSLILLQCGALSLLAGFSVTQPYPPHQPPSSRAAPLRRGVTRLFRRTGLGVGDASPTTMAHSNPDPSSKRD